MQNRSESNKIRIGYIISDSLNSPILEQMIPVFENHNTSLFEIHYFCFKKLPANALPGFYHDMSHFQKGAYSIGKQYEAA